MAQQRPDFMAFARDYQARFVAAVQAWDLQALGRMAELFSAVRDRGGQVLIAGNGGSAGISNHFEVDATKCTHHQGHPPLSTRSLAANVSVITALGNDVAFDEVFAAQVDYYARPGDVLVLISSSGNSPNILKAAQRARDRGIPVVGMVGFAGGRLKDLADVCLHIPAANYGISEDLHQASMHLVTQYLTEAFRPSSP